MTQSQIAAQAGSPAGQVLPPGTVQPAEAGPAASGARVRRADAWAKAAGAARYVADLDIPGMAHVALVRSPFPNARIVAIDARAARAAEGVVGVYTADDVNPTLFGRSVKDVPILAQGRVRYVGEKVAAVVAESRRAAEEAAALVDVDYEELPAVLSAEDAVADGAPAVHDAPWEYPHAAIKPGDGHNLQSHVVHGSQEEAEAALGGCEFVIDREYAMSSVHHGYLEPQACVASVLGDGRVKVWATNKAPYKLRVQVGECLGLDPRSIDVEPVPLGGDFGGKGAPMDVPLCIELSRLTGRPVRLVLRYAEDLTATNPRHPARIRVKVGCDRDGRITGAMIWALLNGGAYGGYKPLTTVNLHGIEDGLLAYDVPAAFLDSRIAYTHTVPRGHMRSPGSPQVTFAVESALDELAGLAGVDPVDLRLRNLVRDGTPNGHGTTWVQARGGETLEAAVAHVREHPPEVPPGWRHGAGIAVYAREVPRLQSTSVRLLPADGGGVRVEVPIPETGTGSHTVVRNILAAELGIGPEQVEVVQVSTDALPNDPGVGGSRVTVAMAEALVRAAQAWRESGGEPVAMESEPGPRKAASSYCAQIAHVAVDPATGQAKILEIVSAVDVGRIVNPSGHQMQIDGGVVMGFGYACLENLAEEDGQIMAANMGEFKVASMRDTPELATVLVTGGQGVTAADVKPVGELTNVPVAAAVANAVSAATGCRIRELPITAEKIYWSLQEAGLSAGREG